MRSITNLLRLSALENNPTTLRRHFSIFPVFQSLLEAAEREKQRHMETRRRKTMDEEEEEEEEEDMGRSSAAAFVAPLLDAKLEKLSDGGAQHVDDLKDSRSRGMDWRFFDLEATLEQHNHMLRKLAMAGNADEFSKWMSRIDWFEEKNFRLPFGGSDIQEMVNSLHRATGERRADLLRKIDRAFKAVQCRDAHDPKRTIRRNEIVKDKGVASSQSYDILHSTGFRKEKQKRSMSGFIIDDEQNKENSETKGFDDLLLRKLVDIERKVEGKLAKLHQTTKDKDESSQEHSDERGIVQKQKLVPLCHKLQGFDVKFIDVYRKSKVTKDGELVKYIVCLACGNYHGVVGFAKADDHELQIAIRKSQYKCFQNLYYIERHEERTIDKPLYSEYEKTKIFLWPAPLGKGMKGSQLVETILHLAGFKDVKSKVIGWMNPQNTIKALLKALNATEILEDV